MPDLYQLLTTKAYNPRQLRWPKGKPIGGQWRGKLASSSLIPVSVIFNLSDIADSVGGIGSWSDTKNSYIRISVQAAIRSIGMIHQIDQMFEAHNIGVRIKKFASEATQGQYHVDFTKLGSAGNRFIHLAENGRVPGLTFIHEFGHYLDDIYSISHLYSDLYSKGAKTWQAAVKKSTMYRLWDKVAEHGALFKTESGENIKIAQAYGKYITSWNELWARSYAQYIVYRSRSNRFLGMELKASTTNPFSAYWRVGDFSDIANAVDAILKERGWLNP